MQTPFGEWLEAKLEERGWNAADLTRASQTPENPRGFDSGLISRWRRPAPLAAMPTAAETLTRLAHAFRVTEAEVYRAAGRIAPDESRVAAAAKTAVAHPRLTGLLAAIETAFHVMTDQEWDVREEAARSLFAVQPIQPTRLGNRRRDGPSTRQYGGRRALDDHARSTDDHGLDGGLPTVFEHLKPVPAPFSLALVLAFLKRPLGPPNRLQTAQPAVAN